MTMAEEKPVIMLKWPRISKAERQEIENIMGIEFYNAEEKWRRLRNIMRDQ